MSRLALVLCVAGCAARARPGPAELGDDITLYRDRAVIRQRIEVAVPATPTTVTVKIAAGVAADQVLVIERGGLTITALHAQTDSTLDGSAAPHVVEASVGGPRPDPSPAPASEPPAAVSETASGASSERVALREPAAPTEVRLDVHAARPGRYAIVIGYVTDRITWDAAYTMTATPRRDHAVLQGALALRNATGILLRAKRARLIDAELGEWRGKTAEQLAAKLVGASESSTPAAAPRELGALALGDGETRVELLRSSTSAMSSVLVYDPIGTKLDNKSATPLRDPRLGTGPAPAQVTESFEVKRDTTASAGLPAGPVRLLERQPSGALVVLGESRLFDAANRVAEVDTIAVGAADGITGARERRELTIDDEQRRLVEEFVITLDNKRAQPAAVLVREHLYRGQNWSLAYPVMNRASGVLPAKEGPQQITLRTVVPARSQTKLLYVVVYTWPR